MTQSPGAVAAGQAFVQIADAARRAGVHPNTIRRLLRSGKLHGRLVKGRHGDTWLVDVEELERLVRTRTESEPRATGSPPRTDSQAAAAVDLSLDRAQALERYTHGLLTPLVDLLREREAALERREEVVRQQAERIGRLERELELLRAQMDHAAANGGMPAAPPPSAPSRTSAPPVTPVPPDAPEAPEAQAEPRAPKAAQAAAAPDGPVPAAGIEGWEDTAAVAAAGATAAGAAAADDAAADDAAASDEGVNDAFQAEVEALSVQMTRLRADLRQIAAVLEPPQVAVPAEAAEAAEPAAGATARDAASASAAGAAPPPEVVAAASASGDAPVAPPAETSVETAAEAAGGVTADASGAPPAFSATAAAPTEESSPELLRELREAVSPEELAGLFPSRRTLRPEEDEPLGAPATQRGAPAEEQATAAALGGDRPDADPFASAEAAVRELQLALARPAASPAAREHRDSFSKGQTRVALVEPPSPEPTGAPESAPAAAPEQVAQPAPPPAAEPPAEPEPAPAAPRRRRWWFW